MVRVCALLVAPGPALEAGLAAQERPPEEVVRVGDASAARPTGLAAAATEWLWLLDGSARPLPGTLAALVAALSAVEGLPPPVLLASKLVREDGALAGAHVPWYRRRQTDVTMLAVARRLLPVRATRTGSVLVRRDAFARSLGGPSVAAAGGLAWTARLLRSAAGYLVPASAAVVADAATGDEDGEQSLRTVARLVLADALTGRERLQLAAEVAASRAIRAG